MDPADHVLPVGSLEAQANDPLGQAIEVAQAMASETALKALDRAIVVAQSGGTLAAQVGEAKALADESVRAAQYMQCQLSAVDALLRISELVGR
jgi:hypothetical protein